MKHIIKIALLLNVQTTLIFAQLIGDGTQTPFTFGVESRAYSLGNAAVAFPQDASAMFWNPAGMVVIDQQLFGVSMSTLFEGTQYQYGGLIIPTLATGTFGIGVVRIGTDDIPRTEWSDQTIDHLGNMDYWWGQLNLAYGLRVYKGLAVGVAFEANRIVLGDWSTNGFGLNSGIHYALPHQSGLLSNLHIGIAAHSIVHPQLSLGTQTRAIPMTLRGGMAKIFKLGQNNRMLMIADIEKPELGEMRYHMGAEFMFGSILAVRAGLNNGQMTFGCGVRYADISFDYATGQLNGYGLMPWTHRFSLNIHMGPTLSDKRAKIEEIRQHDIETRFQARLESDRQRRIREGLRDAREFLDKADYFNARLEVGSVLDLEPDHRTAKNLLSDIEGKEAEYQAEREAALLKEARQNDIHQRDIQYIRQRRTEANDAISEGNVRGAIEAWEMALSRDPEDVQIRNNLEQARTRLDGLITELIAEARRLIRQEAISAAYKKLDRAKNQAQGVESLLIRVNHEMTLLNREVDFLHNSQEGEKRFENKDYEGAVHYLERALQYKPDHESVKEMLQISRALMTGSSHDMRDDVYKKYIQGIRLYRKKNYIEALQVWQEALKLDPSDTQIIRAIRGVRRKLQNIKEN